MSKSQMKRIDAMNGIKRCGLCGQRVSVSTSDEGTSCYVGEEYNRAIEDAARVVDEHLLYSDSNLAYAIRALKK